jgi:hypothetical protein
MRGPCGGKAINGYKILAIDMEVPKLEALGRSDGADSIN